MTRTKQRELSLTQELEASPVGAREMAASALTNSAIVTLELALAASGMSQKDLAEALGIGESRISQVMNGDGNIRVTTFARYMRALGYAVDFAVRPVEPGRPELVRPRRTR